MSGSRITAALRGAHPARPRAVLRADAAQGHAQPAAAATADDAARKRRAADDAERAARERLGWCRCRRYAGTAVMSPVLDICWRGAVAWILAIALLPTVLR